MATEEGLQELYTKWSRASEDELKKEIQDSAGTVRKTFFNCKSTLENLNRCVLYHRYADNDGKPLDHEQISSYCGELVFQHMSCLMDNMCKEEATQLKEFEAKLGSVSDLKPEVEAQLVEKYQNVGACLGKFHVVTMFDMLFTTLSRCAESKRVREVCEDSGLSSPTCKNAVEEEKECVFEEFCLRQNIGHPLAMRQATGNPKDDCYNFYRYLLKTMQITEKK